MTPKFKAITTDGKWVEGDKISDGEKVFINQHNTMSVRYAQKEDESYKHVYELWHCIEVIPETVCQFTGLYDKNGREIFKHDCLRNPKGEEGVIVWSNGRARFELKSENKKGEERYIELSQGFCNNKELIGSIHDHLLKH